LEQELASQRRNGNSQQRGNLQQQGPALHKPATEYQSPTEPLEFYPRGSSPIVPMPALPPEDVPLDQNSILESTDAPRSDTPRSDTPQRETVQPSSPFPSNDLPSPNLPDDDEFDLDSLLPEITPGEPMPPPPVVTETVNGRSVPPEDDLELNLSRIEVPARLASRRKNMEGIHGATITPAVEQVTDKRVVELGFHPSLSRAVNFDDRSDDDGLYLVLQPLNERGQMVPVAADLLVDVIDLAREGKAARIGRWNYSAQEVKSKLQPIGSNQGIHLRLPWNGPDPIADRVVVFVWYTFPNGRQVIGEKTIFVASDDGLKAVWRQRSSSNNVTHAGYQNDHSPASPRSTVVRPSAPASSTLAPAPPQ